MKLQQKVIQIPEKKENVNVIRMLGLAGEDMSESKYRPMLILWI